MRNFKVGDRVRELDVYEWLRTFHNELKDLLGTEMDSQKELTLQTLHHLLYMVEREFTNLEN